MKRNLFAILFIVNSVWVLAQQTDSFLFEIGNTWTYETVESFNQAPPYLYDYRSVQIMDTFNINGNNAYELNTGEKFYFDDKKMYFWDPYLNDYQLYYDFDFTQNYQVSYWDIILQEERTAEIMLDSISNSIIGLDTISVYYFNAYHNIGGQNQKFEVYENIGATRGGIRVELGCGLCDDDFIVGDLRCFQNEVINVNFLNVPCDTTYNWVPNSTEDGDYQEIFIYPNPSNNSINIKGANGKIDFRIYTMMGELIHFGSTLNNKILIEKEGIFLIAIRVNDNWIIKKVVRLN